MLVCAFRRTHSPVGRAFPGGRLHEVVKKCYRGIDSAIGIPEWNLPY